MIQGSIDLFSEDARPARAKRDVQLVSHTVFTPPMVEEEDGNIGWVFWPDDENEVKVPLGAMRQFDGQAVAEFAGRACYQSFDRPNPKTATNKGYLHHIQEQKHDNVLEHASAGFYITGISRTCSHELVRHRHFTYSQLSQRYVNGKDSLFVVPQAILDEMRALVEAEYPDETPVNPFTNEECTYDDVVDYMGDQWAKEMRAACIERYDDVVGLLSDEESKLKLSKKQIRQAARSELPGATETRLVMTGNYRAWKGFLQQRISPAADVEINDLAVDILGKLAELAPNVFGEEARKTWDGSIEHGEAKH